MRKLLASSIALFIFLPTAAYAYHEDDGCDDRDGYCNSQQYDQNYGSRDDRNRNRNRNRGAFSPGPFQDSPVDAFNNMCLPGATCYYDGKKPDQPTPSA